MVVPDKLVTFADGMSASGAAICDVIVGGAAAEVTSRPADLQRIRSACGGPKVQGRWSCGGDRGVLHRASYPAVVDSAWLLDCRPSRSGEARVDLRVFPVRGSSRGPSLARRQREDQYHGPNHQEWSDVGQPDQEVTDGRPGRDCESPHNRQGSAPSPKLCLHANSLRSAVTGRNVTKVLERGALRIADADGRRAGWVEAKHAAVIPDHGFQVKR
jgi:hypothetical protein